MLSSTEVDTILHGLRSALRCLCCPTGERPALFVTTKRTRDTAQSPGRLLTRADFIGALTADQIDHSGLPIRTETGTSPPD